MVFTNKQLLQNLIGKNKLRAKPPSDFQKKVRDIVYGIEVGNVITYGELSKLIFGHQKGGKALGAALKYWWHHPEYTDEWGLHRVMANRDHYEKGHRSEEELDKHPNRNLMKKFIHPQDKKKYWGRTAYLRQKEGYYSKNNLTEPIFI
jgi:alkylated DNA nucleotide flippase Atl1